MAKKKRKNKKKVISIIIIIIILLVGGIATLLNTLKLSVELNKEIEIPLNGEYYNTNGVKTIKNGKITTDKELIDTSKIGRQTIEIEIKGKIGKKKKYTYEVNIVDKESPKIEYKEELETEYNKEIDLLNGVSATDNSGEDIVVMIEGDYNLKEAGTYTLYYIARDSSGNETKEEFKLIVKEKEEEKSVTSSTNNNNNNGNSNVNSNTNKDTTFTTSKGFNGYTRNGVTYIDGVLIANKTYSLPSTYTGGSSTKGLTTDTYNAFLKMQAAASLDGINIYVQSGYRSYDTQKRLYNNYVARDGKVAADTYSARPGNSEHQTGLGFDVCSSNVSGCINDDFNGTAPANWLSENAYKYGFILRYPQGKSNETGYKYESWHFRYVGVDLATKLYNDGDWITLESYFGITSKYDE